MCKKTKQRNAFITPKEYTYDDCDREYALAKLAKEVAPGFRPPLKTDNEQCHIRA